MTTILSLSDVKPGFPNPVLDSQSTFRQVLDSLCRPGSIRTLQLDDYPDGLNQAMGAIALTLFDYDTPIWISDGEMNDAIAQWLRFHCSCPITPKPEEAAFALCPSPNLAPSLSSFAQGDTKYPDRSTTIIYEVEQLTGGDPVTLHGPGIEETVTISPKGLPAAFWSEWDENAGQFQLGVDVLLTAGDQLLGLPRTSRRVSQS
ncbi:MAG: phosphonate C-P lyase system protein PhnH [Pseudomonadota bacterium]